MEIVLLEIDDAIAIGVFDIGIADVPLFGNGPVERLRATRN